MNVTPGAAKQLELLLGPDEHLMIGLEGGGCGGATITLERVDSTSTDGWNTIETGHERIVWADQASATYLTGGNLDYDDGAFNATFVFKPPLGTESCGCGASIKIG